MDFDKVLDLMQEEKMYAEENHIPIIRDESAKFLYDFVKNGKYKKVLEIATAIGFSGSLILSAGAECLVTIDINEKSLDVAKNTFLKLGFSEKTKIFKDDAYNVICKLRDEKQKFDMIFLDGAKGQYIKYLPILKGLLNNQGVIFADNVLLGGMVESKEKIPHRKRTMVVNLRKYLELVNEPPYITELIRLEDGIAITKIEG